MKIYIAASSRPEERPRVDAAFAGAAAAGIIVLGDWRPDVDLHGANPADLLTAQASARKDFRAVRDCDATWLLVPSEGGRGCWVELGIALCLQEERGFPVAVASGVTDVSIFTSLCYRTFRSDLEALRYLCGGRRAPRA